MYLSQLPFCLGLRSQECLLFLGTVPEGRPLASCVSLFFLTWTVKEFIPHEMLRGRPQEMGVVLGRVASIVPCNKQPPDLSWLKQ